MRAVPKLYSISEREFKFLNGINNILYKTGLAATAAGLTGMAINHFIGNNGNDSSELVNAIRDYSAPSALGGALIGTYFGLLYHTNRCLNKNRKPISN